MKKHPPEYFLKHIQKFLNQIALCGPDERMRVEIIGARAKRMMRQFAKEHPTYRAIVEQRNPEVGDMRRIVPPSDSGASPESHA